MTVIEQTISSVLKFCHQFIVGPLKYKTVTSIYLSFKERANLLFKGNDGTSYIVSINLLVITKLVKRGYQPHLEEFLLRLNFNAYYR